MPEVGGLAQWIEDGSEEALPASEHGARQIGFVVLSALKQVYSYQCRPD